MNIQGELTYAGTSGHSGTDTSRDRAARQDNDGTTGRIQRMVQRALSIAGERGMTVAELRHYIKDAHHGQVSSALTNLHRAGKIVRLSEKRDRCKVYVLRGYEAGRREEKPTVKGGRRDDRLADVRRWAQNTPEPDGLRSGDWWLGYYEARQQVRGILDVIAWKEDEK